MLNIIPKPKRWNWYVLSSGERVTSALLSIALNEMGLKAMSMSGRQAGIITDNAHTKTRIESYWYNWNEKCN